MIMELSNNREKLIPARNIHPNVILFREIAAAIAGDLDDDDGILFEQLCAFLKGGVMTEQVKISVSTYFGQNPQTWQNLWDNYTKHSEEVLILRM